MRKLLILVCISFIFLGYSKKSPNENKPTIQNEGTVIVNSSNNNIVISDSAEAIIINGDNNTVSTESSAENKN
ncbi:MAG: hypothetical protein IKK38_01520 [Spirochaetaceae bacterium]|nr:hypothetical protein [Spirochaetaceae bacterium]